jgi:hypothetical protein
MWSSAFRSFEEEVDVVGVSEELTHLRFAESFEEFGERLYDVLALFLGEVTLGHWLEDRLDVLQVQADHDLEPDLNCEVGRDDE